MQFNPKKKTLYKVKLIHDPIKLYYITGLLTCAECDHIINLANPHFTPSMVQIGHKQVIDNTSRTSYSYAIPKSYDQTIINIELRINKFLKNNVPDTDCWSLVPHMIEHFQVVRYTPGQFFKGHYDISSDIQRYFTFFVYLNDIFEGGETVFPKIDKTFNPIKGDSLFWQNCDENGKCLEDTFHQGNPPMNNIKYGLNIWIKMIPNIS
jgi:prolyl 4-hydroxylase